MVSLLLEKGHPHARRYPWGMLCDEARIATERENAMLTTRTLLFQAALGTVYGGKKGATRFMETIKRLIDGD